MESTTPSPHVAGKREKRREEIAETAMDIIATEGLAQLKVTTLASRLSVTPGALYRYFPSIESVLAHLQTRAIASLASRVVTLSASSACAAERLHAVARGYLATAKVAPHEMQLISQMLADPHFLLSDDAASPNAQGIRGLLLFVATLIDEIVAAGEFCAGDSKKRAAQLWAALQGAVSLGKLQRFEAELFDVERLGSDLVASLFTAWAKEGSPS